MPVHLESIISPYIIISLLFIVRLCWHRSLQHRCVSELPHDVCDVAFRRCCCYCLTSDFRPLRCHYIWILFAKKLTFVRGLNPVFLSSTTCTQNTQSLWLNSDSSRVQRIRFLADTPPWTPLAELTVLPQPITGLRGPTCKIRWGDGKERGWEGEGRRGERKEGRDESRNTASINSCLHPCHVPSGTLTPMNTLYTLTYGDSTGNKSAVQSTLNFALKMFIGSAPRFHSSNAVSMSAHSETPFLDGERNTVIW